MTNMPADFQDEDEVEDFKPLTAQEASAWRSRFPQVSVWRIVMADTRCPWRTNAGARCLNWPGKFWWTKRMFIASRNGQALLPLQPGTGIMNRSLVFDIG